jgi:hypothetical protein
MHLEASMINPYENSIENLSIGLITLEQAANLLPKRNGRPVTEKTIRSWMREGLRGVRLKFVRIGGRRFTSVEYVEEFIKELTETDVKKQVVTSYHQTRFVSIGLIHKLFRLLEQHKGNPAAVEEIQGEIDFSKQILREELNVSPEELDELLEE